MKYIKLCLCALCMFTLFTISGCNSETENIVKVGIVQISEHDSLNTIRKAAVKEIRKQGYDEDKCEVIYKNAGGDANTLQTIINDFKEKNVDVVIPISTPAAQAAAVLSEDTPIVFAAVSDPVAAKLVEAIDKTDGNITGTSNAIQVDQIMEEGLKLYPNIQKMGLIYNSGEVNAVSTINKVKAYCKENGIETVETSITNTSEVSQATNSLIDEGIDSIFIPNDNTLINCMDVIAPILNENKIPSFSGVDTFVSGGALLNVGIDYETLGKETGKMVVEILDGASTDEIEVMEFKTNLNTYLNKSTVKALGLNLDEFKTDNTIVYFE